MHIYICIYIIYTYVYIYIEPLGILTSYKEYIYIYIHVCLLPSSLGPRHCADGQQEGTAAAQSRQVRLRQWLAETSDLGC